MTRKKICLSLHYNEAKRYLFLMVQKLLNLKQNEINAMLLFL